MAAKGAIVKAEMMEKLQEVFPTAFSPDGKVLHVDMVENGNPVQIKIALTAVKSPISNNPESQVINEAQFSLEESEKTDLVEALKEMGVEF